MNYLIVTGVFMVAAISSKMQSTQLSLSMHEFRQLLSQFSKEVNEPQNNFCCTSSENLKNVHPCNVTTYNMVITAKATLKKIELIREKKGRLAIREKPDGSICYYHKFHWVQIEW